MFEFDKRFRILLLLAAIGAGVMMFFSDYDEKIREEVRKENSR